MYNGDKLFLLIWLITSNSAVKKSDICIHVTNRNYGRNTHAVTQSELSKELSFSEDYMNLTKTPHQPSFTQVSVYIEMALIGYIYIAARPSQNQTSRQMVTGKRQLKRNNQKRDDFLCSDKEKVSENNMSI